MDADRKTARERSHKAYTTSACLSPLEWSKLIRSKRESSKTIDDLFDHLEHCPDCSERLKQIAGEHERDFALKMAGGDAKLFEESALHRLKRAIGQSLLRNDENPLGEDCKDFGRFRIIERLGAGGFGVVYLAEDVSLNRKLALKVPRCGSSMSQSELQQFIWEGRAAASLRHPNVNSVLEAGECDGIPYIASDYCAGPRLSEIMAAGPIPFDAAAKVVLQLALGVQHAHSQGVLHRDIKPSNVLLDQDNQIGIQLDDHRYVPKLTDFGLAKPITQQDASTQESTRTGFLRGTPGYMAPEYLNGNAEIRSDVYALGVVLYEMLSGTRLFSGLSILDRLRQASANTEVTSIPFSDRRIPRDLETICLKCLRNDACERYDTVKHLADDLGRFIRGEPISARSLTSTEKLFRWVRNRPSQASLVGLTALLPLALVLGLSLHNRRLGKALTQVAASERTARELLYSADVRQMFQAWEGADFKTFKRFEQKYDRVSTNSQDPRGIEWAFLKRLTSLESGEVEWQAHEQSVSCVRFAPNGEVLATASTDGTIAIWDIRTRQQRQLLEGHDGDVNKLAFLDDGRTLASVGDDSRLIIWDFLAGRALRTIDTQGGRTFELGVDRLREKIVTAGDGPEVCFWDLNTGELSATLPGAMIRALAIHPEAPYIGLASSDESPRFWMLEYGREPTIERMNVADAGAIGDMVFSHDGGRLAVASRLGIGRIYNAADGSLLMQLEGHRDAVRAVAFSNDDQYLATTSEDATIRIWDMFGKQLKTLRGHLDSVWTLDFSPSGTSLATGDSTGHVRLWNWTELEELRYDAIAQTLGNVHSSTVSQLSKGRILTSSAQGMFQLLGTEGQTLQRFGEAELAGSVTSVEMMQGESLAVVGTRGGAVQLWDLNTESQVGTLEAEQRAVWCLKSLGERLLFVAGEEGVCRVWDVEAGQIVATGDGHTKPILSCDVSPDGQRVVTASVDGSARLWSLPDLKLLGTFSGHDGVVRDVAFAPDGKTFVTCGHDRSLLHHNIESGERLAHYQGHKSRILSVQFAADGKTVLSGDATGTLCFWRVGTSELLGKLDTGITGVVDIHVASDGSSLSIVTGTPTSGHGSYLRWDLPSFRELVPSRQVRRATQEFSPR